MIKANELRIGNLVYGFKTIWQIDSTDFRNYDTDTGELPYDPIPLTPEILEAFGFKRYDIGETDEENAWILPVDQSDKNNYLSKFTLTNEMEYCFRDDFTGRLHYVKVGSAHQLQNLYFALTGEELEYKHEMAVNENGRLNKKP